MDALTLLRDQAAFAEKLMTDIFAPVTVDQAIWQPDSSTANPIAVIFLHVYTGQDRLIGRAHGKPPILDAGGWSERLGYDSAQTWSPIVHPDLDAYRAYAAELSIMTTDYLSNLDPDTLEKEIESPRGRRTVAAALSLVLTMHKLTHAGEIAALLGCQGVKGLPF